MSITLPHWDAHAIAGEPLSSILADLREHRAPGALGDLLMDAVSLADIYEDCDQLIALDAIIVPFKTLNRKMAALMNAMKRTGSDVHPVKVDISEPFTQRGSAQVAVIFTLSDGQTVTVFFHNPDTTPKRIKPTDELVSWKWLLNKKDVTIVVAAEHGEDLKVQDVARRVMLLAQKNSTAFKRLNAKKSERDATIQGLKDEITTLEATLKQERELLEAAKAGGGLGKSEAVAIRGDELGSFPDTEEGKKALREAVRKHLMDMRGEWVDCPALDAKVEIRKRGIEKALSASADVRKLKIMSSIKSLIRSASLDGSGKPYNQPDDKSAVEYYTLRANALLDDEPLNVRLIVKKDVNGSFHYDATVHDVDVVLDSAQEEGHDEARPFLPLLPMVGERNPSHFASDQLDSSLEPGRVYVNLFIEGEDPDAVEDDVVETATATNPIAESETTADAPQSPDDGLSDDPNAPNYRYADTGFIAGARKFDVTETFREAVKNGQLLRVRDLDWEGVEENPRRAKELIVKSNLFGKVDWAGLRESGVEPGAAFLMDRVYASIASAPYEDTPGVRKDYALGIESVRERLETCKTADEVKKTLDEMYDEKRGIMLDEVESAAYQEAEAEAEKASPRNHPLVIENNRLIQEAGKAQRELWARTDELRKAGRKATPEMTAAKNKAERAYQLADEAQRNFMEQNPALKSVKRDLGNGRFTFENDIEHAYRNARDKARLILDINMARNLASNPTTRAWNALGDRFASVLNGKSEAFAGHRAAVRMGKVKDWSWAEKDGATKAPTKRAARFQLQVADSFDRVGGREVKVASTAELKERFGLREVQSGNWVLKDPESAQWHVQKAAEAMTDLADLIGVDPSKLAVGGRVALAFGARGKGNAGFGGGAAAHYEPVERVINITKMKGGGSLAHEWFHALDNLIPESMGLDNGENGMVTENAELRAKLPPAVASALERLVDAMRTGDQRANKIYPVTEAMRERAKSFFASPNNGYGGISKAIKEAGSVQAAMDVIESLENDLKASYLRRGKKFTKREADTYESWRPLALGYYAKDDEVKVEIGKPMSSFALEATKLDAGSSKNYWSTTLEMAARAFQGYVEDSLAAKGQKNDYLSAKADNKFYKDPMFGDSKPFPEGEERARINKAFDELFKALRGTGVLDSVFAMLL